MNLNPTSNDSDNRWRILGLLLLLFLPSLLFVPALFRDSIPEFMDPLMYFFPLRWHAGQLVQGGELPLWNRCLMGGMPLFSNPQAAVGYPLHWPMLIAPSGVSYTLPLLLQLGLWAGASSLVVWTMGGRSVGAFWAGTMCLAGAYGWTRLQSGNFMNVLPWVPLWLVAGECFARQRRTRALAGGAASIALMLLGGGHQLAAYMFLAMLSFALVLAVGSREAQMRMRLLEFVGISFIAGALFGAPGWLPQMAFLSETGRSGGIDETRILSGAVHGFGELFRLMCGPFSLEREAGEHGFSVGLLLPILALWKPKARRETVFWLAAWAATALMCVIALASVNALILKFLPQLSLFHAPRRALGGAHMFLILAAGLSASDLASRVTEKTFAARVTLYSMLAVILLSSAAITLYRTDFGMVPVREILEPGGREPLLVQIDSEPGERFYSLDFIRDYSYGFRRGDLADAALPNLGMLWGREDIGGYEPARSRRYDQWLASASDWPSGRQPWAQHFGLIFPAQNVNSPKRLALEEANITHAIVPRWGYPIYTFPHEGNFAGETPAWDWSGVPLRVVVLDVDESAGPPLGLSLVVQGPEFRKQWLGQDWGEGRTDPTGGFDWRVFEALVESNYSGRGIALVGRTTDAIRFVGLYRGFPEDAVIQADPESSAPFVRLEFPDAPGWLTLNDPASGRKVVPLASDVSIEANHTELNIRTDFATSGTLTMRDAWWPGWTATVNGAAVPVLPSGKNQQGLWRTIDLPAGGEWHVELSYWPPLLTESFGLVLLGLVICGFFGYRIRRNRNSASPDAVTCPDKDDT